MDLKYIDIGINLMGKQFASDRDKVVEESLEKGVGLIITGTDMRSNKDAASYLKAKRPENVWCTCGLHPHNADRWNPDYKRDFTEFIRKNKENIVALGEAGLDYDRMFSTKENQQKCFSDILELAEEMDLPLFLHERDAGRDFIKLMKEHPSVCSRSVVHCFTGSKDMARQYLQLGCYIGITGWICDDRRNHDAVEAVKLIPMERLMIETDAPYLTPRNIKGLSSRNVPWNIAYVAQKIAEIKETDTEEVRRITLQNTKKFFGF